MPRMSLNLNNSNIELLEFTSEEVKLWMDHPNPHNEIGEKLETAIDEAYQEIAEGTSEIEYVVIKIIK